ncbi:YggS family pyridoxal phosphate-dependent enzyme [Neobacillus sp. SM06]|uniref:YggS family pyridoxal phosphate-dependent enzyme n=1 Tax=Neobacillus sp. SM06 TaxID=3422492 RepID=UPI003D2C4E01
MKVAAKLEAIQQQIADACFKVHRNPEEVRLIAVTKYVSTKRAQEALDAGVCELGENRDDGLLEKWSLLKDKPVWHFIGSLQTRKVKNIIDKIDYIHSLDRISLAEEIQKRSPKKIKCLVQVNVSGEESKHGLHPDEVIPFIEQLQAFDKIGIVGLMTMAPLTNDEEVLRNCFRLLRELREQVKARQFAFAPCDHLSMGMSNDFHIAVEEGATMVRIGTALVGEDEERVTK